MGIDKKVEVEVLFVRTVFVGIGFVSSIILSFLITDSSIILAKYLLFYM